MRAPSPRPSCMTNSRMLPQARLRRRLDSNIVGRLWKNRVLRIASLHACVYCLHANAQPGADLHSADESEDTEVHGEV